MGLLLLIVLVLITLAQALVGPLGDLVPEALAADVAHVGHDSSMDPPKQPKLRSRSRSWRTILTCGLNKTLSV